MEVNLLTYRSYYNIFLTNACNKACDYCVVKHLINAGNNDINKDSLFQYMDRAKKGDLVEITGGEPTTVPWLEEFIAYLNDKEVYILLRTNGFELFKNIYKWLVIVYCGHGDEITAETRGKLRDTDIILGETLPLDIFDPSNPDYTKTKPSGYSDTHPFTNSRHITYSGWVSDMTCKVADDGTRADACPYLVKLNGSEYVDRDLIHKFTPCPTCKHITVAHCYIKRLNLEDEVEVAIKPGSVPSQVYNNLVDEESRLIFEAVYNYGANERCANIVNYSKYCRAMAHANQKLLENKGKDIYAAVENSSQNFAQCVLPDWNFKGVISLSGQVAGTISVSDYLMLRGEHTKVWPWNSDGYHNDLIKSGIPESDILGRWEEQQYFDLEHIIPLPVEVFVDCGVYDGKTTDRYLNWAGNRAGHVVMFEPNPAFYYEVRDRYKNNPKINTVNRALWSESNRTLNFVDDMDSSRIVADDRCSSYTVETVTLDYYFANSLLEPTFIKMDIEGAELQALQGGLNIIRKYRPRLAVAAYHKVEDLWNIGKFLLAHFDRYQLFIRHYSLSYIETVLYAVPVEQVDYRRLNNGSR
jgi:FkbM family methyltransferase